MISAGLFGLFYAVIAFVYASVGFGGGSSYLALLAVAGLPFQEMRLIALLCNVIVVTGGAVVFIQNRQINVRKILPLVLVSVPAAFWGAKMRISEETFFLLLGLSLDAAAVLLWCQHKARSDGQCADPNPGR